MMSPPSVSLTLLPHRDILSEIKKAGFFTAEVGFCDGLEKIST